MRKITALFLIALFGLSFQLKAQEIPMDPALRYGKLDNGMTYYIRHNEEPKERASFYIAQNVGAILENDEQNGLAHFLEHMAFNGTKHFPGKGIITFLEKHGVTFGRNINAYTARDETVYNLSNVPTTKEGLLDSCLLVLNDWSNYLLLSEEEIDAERGVIAEEWRTRRNSQFRVMEKQNKALLAGSKYGERDVIGSLDVIKNHDYKTLRDFYHDWYRTDLQAIIIVGDFDVDKMEAKVKELFSKIPAVENPKKREYFTIPDNDEPNYALATDKESRFFAVGVISKTPKATREEKNDKSYLEGLYKRALFNQMVGARIQEQMQSQPPFLQAQVQLGGFLGDKNSAAVFAVYPEGKWEKAFRGAAELTEKIRRYGFTQDELDRAKTNLLASFENAYKMREKTNHDAYAKEYKSHFIDNDPVPGIEYEFEVLKDLAEKLDLSEFKAMAQDLLSKKNMSVIVNGPEKEGVEYPSKEDVLRVIDEVKSSDIEAYKDSFVDKPLISEEPKEGEIVSRKNIKVDKLEATELMLSNGIRVLYRKSDLEKENIVCTANSWGGTSLLNNDQLINAGFLGDFMGEYGLGDFSKMELQKKLTGKIAGCGFSIGGLSESISGRANPKDLETMFQLMYLRFTQPRFDGKQYMNLYSRTVQSIANIENDPGKAFKDSVSVTLSSHHPRVKPFTKNDMEKVSFGEMKQIYLDRFANPADFVFTFSGNFDVEKLESYIKKYIASLPTTDAKETYKDNGVRRPEKDVNNYFQRKLETPKNTVYVNLSKEAKYSQQDAIYSYVISKLLSKRYLEEIREKEGGTYGVSVNASLNKRPYQQFTLALQFDCDPEKADKLKGIALDEIDQLTKGEIVEKDLEEIKSNILKERSEQVNKLSYWHSLLNTYAIEDKLGMNDTEYENFIHSINAKKVVKKAKKLLKDAVKVEVIMSPEQ